MPVLVVPAVAAGIASCGRDAPSAPGRPATTVDVVGTDTSCTPARTTVPAGPTTFRLWNDAAGSSELYVLRPDGTMVGERENIGPGTSGELTVELPAGDYALRCKPGMKGDGIRSPLKVSGRPPPPPGPEDRRGGRLLPELGEPRGRVVPGRRGGAADRDQGRGRRRGQGRLRLQPVRLGGDRAGRRGVRRHRPEGRPARGRPGARREVDRLARDREEPVPAGSVEGMQPVADQLVADLRCW